MTKNHSDEEIKTFFLDLINDKRNHYYWQCEEVEVSEDCCGRTNVRCASMYETPIPNTDWVYSAIQEKFDLLDVDDYSWHQSGCETCDYGSEYVREFTLTFKEDN